VNNENLIRMANQIGQFFESMPDRADAEAGIANHLKKFWDPRMRRAFLAAIDSQTADGLIDIVQSAVALHRAEIV
jgi:formate dehydrogenase subunit delta